MENVTQYQRSSTDGEGRSRAGDAWLCRLRRGQVQQTLTGRVYWTKGFRPIPLLGVGLMSWAWAAERALAHRQYFKNDKSRKLEIPTGTGKDSSNYSEGRKANHYVDVKEV